MSLAFLKGQLTYLTKRGFRFVVVSSPGPALNEFARAEGVEAIAVPIRRRPAPLHDLMSIIRLCRIIRIVRPDIVHAHTPKAGLLGMIAARLTGVRGRIYHMRGLPFVTTTGVKRWVLKQAETLACRLASAVICVGPSVKRAAAIHGLCSPLKSKVMANGSGNGVDAAGKFAPKNTISQAEARTRLGIPPEATVVGFVGRLVRDKGIVELEQAWRTISGRHARTWLLLVGPIEAADPIPESVLAALRSHPRVVLHGADWDTPRLYAAMDIVVLPTHREGFPNVPLEAAAMGLPVVATAIPECADAVEDGKTATLIPLRDHTAIEMAIERYIMDASFRREHGEAGRIRALHNFGQTAVWDSIGSTYEILLEADR